MMRLKRRDLPPLTVTLIADTSRFDEAMRRVAAAFEESARVIGERLIEGLRPAVAWLDFRFWLMRSGQRTCLADHADLVGRCGSCGAEL